MAGRGKISVVLKCKVHSRECLGPVGSRDPPLRGPPLPGFQHSCRGFLCSPHLSSRCAGLCSSSTRRRRGARAQPKASLGRAARAGGEGPAELPVHSLKTGCFHPSFGRCSPKISAQWSWEARGDQAALVAAPRVTAACFGPPAPSFLCLGQRTHTCVYLAVMPSLHPAAAGPAPHSVSHGARSAWPIPLVLLRVSRCQLLVNRNLLVACAKMQFNDWCEGTVASWLSSQLEETWLQERF